MNKRGLVVSSKGPGGGYSLAHDPKDIRLSDVVHAVDGAIDIDSTCVLGLDECRDDTPYALHDFWKSFRMGLTDMMGGLNQTLTDLLDRDVWLGGLDEKLGTSNPDLIMAELYRDNSLMQDPMYAAAAHMIRRRLSEYAPYFLELAEQASRYSEFEPGKAWLANMASFMPLAVLETAAAGYLTLQAGGSPAAAMAAGASISALSMEHHEFRTLRSELKDLAPFDLPPGKPLIDITI